MQQGAKMARALDGDPISHSEVRALTRRLDVIISLLAEWQPAEGRKRSAREQTIRLYLAGLQPVEIAAITGRHASNVGRDVSAARKEGRIPKSVR